MDTSSSKQFKCGVLIRISCLGEFGLQRTETSSMDKRYRLPRIFSPSKNFAQELRPRKHFAMQSRFLWSNAKERARSRPKAFHRARRFLSRNFVLISTCAYREKSRKFRCNAQRSSCDRVARNSVIFNIGSASLRFFRAVNTCLISFSVSFFSEPSSPRLRFFYILMYRVDFSRSDQSRRSRSTSERDRLL